MSFRSQTIPNSIRYIIGVFCLLVAVYVPGRGDHSVAKNLISEHVDEMVTTHPDAAVLLMGDFNWCDMDRHLPGYHQFVNFSTREGIMLDLFYCNVKNSYKAYKQHQLGSSDHSLVYLAPVYKQKLKTGKVQTRTIKKWDASSVEQLQGCLAGTDWSVFLEDNPFFGCFN